MLNKVAVITGSSGGVGSSLVQTYLDDGYFVIGLDRIPSKYIKRNYYSEIDVNLHSFSKDISYRYDVIKKIKEYLPNNLKKLVLINNAAEQILKSVSELEWEDFDASLSVNTFASFFLVKGLLEELQLSHGSVINISSIHAKLTKPRFACYAASKAALEALTRSLALELSPIGISVNAVAPAAISTEMLKEGFKDTPDKLKLLKNYHPSRRIGTPEELSFIVKSITDQDGGYLTGAVIDFNGGIAGLLHDPE